MKKYRIYLPSGRILNAGSDRPSWFDLQQAYIERAKNRGSKIYECDGERKIWEIC